MECTNCKTKMETTHGPRPENFLALHRAEGVMIIPFCGKQECQDKVAFFLLGVATDSKKQKEIVDLIKN